MNKTLTALKGVRVGHSTHLDKLTGCSVILFDKPMPVAYKGYGGAIGSFNTEHLRAGMTSYKENGIFVAGGSNTGLMAGGQILDCLRKDKIGFANGPARDIYNPNLTGAIVFDMGMQVAPFDPVYGKEAYDNASADIVASGNVGAGTGASVGKLRFVERGTKSGAMKAGVGNARVDLGNGIVVCALTVLNAQGNIYLPDSKILAGNRDEQTVFRDIEDVQNFVTNNGSNTTISIVGINVDLKSKEHYERVAHLASHGQVRAINPVNTSMDGDSIFVFSNEELSDPLNNMAKYFLETESDIHFQVDLIGNAAAKAVQESIYDACQQAESVPLESAWQGTVPSAKDYPNVQ